MCFGSEEAGMVLSFLFIIYEVNSDSINDLQYYFTSYVLDQNMFFWHIETLRIMPKFETFPMDFAFSILFFLLKCL